MKVHQAVQETRNFALDMALAPELMQKTLQIKFMS